ncbi:hypothetical protein MMC14_004377 [Varicellaria rhodocarpa]|nr:hypothetical protein [Varicellaria rhodocarpa]
MEKGNEDELGLSSDALSALQEFYAERDQRERRFEDLKAAAEHPDQNSVLSMDTFVEDWNASQFWYSNDTATLLAKRLLEGATSQNCIAVVSVPSVFVQIKNLLASGQFNDPPKVYLFEFDERFSILKEYVYYDFHSPLKLDSEFKGKFDRIICDPPFLSTDCQTKAAMTVRWLSTTSPPPNIEANLQLIICTGERMGSLITKLYSGVKMTDFEPQHVQGRLSNEFRCYANLECVEWSWV